MLPKIKPAAQPSGQLGRRLIAALVRLRNCFEKAAATQCQARVSAVLLLAC